MKKIISLLSILIVLSTSINAKEKKKKEKAKKGTYVEMKTTHGTMVLMLYKETPKHTENFLKLTKEGFYNDVLFHRVINAFMIQGGDPASKTAKPGDMLGSGSLPGERIPAEFNADLIHKKGALAAARDGNPQKASSNCQFYIVQGKTFTDAELDRFEINSGWKYTAAQREIYKTIGGTPHLDNAYTVYGELVAGFDVLDKIASLPTNQMNRPNEDVRIIQAKVLKKYKVKKNSKTKAESKQPSVVSTPEQNEKKKKEVEETEK